MGLLELPPELRLMIYKLVFASVTITFGKTKDLRSRDPLRFMRTCRSVYLDTSQICPGDALLDFTGAARFLVFMMSSDPAFIRRIRRVSIAARGFSELRAVNFETLSCRKTYMDQVLHLVKGLRLDCLMLRYVDGDQSAPFHGIYGDFEIEQLLCAGNGWKELIYYVPSDVCMRPTKLGLDTLVTDRPSEWNRLISSRDGADSGASVNVYLVQTKQTVAETGTTSTVTNYKQLRQRPDNPRLHEVDIVRNQISYWPRRCRRQRCTPESPHDDAFKDSGIMIVARRGKQAPYMQDGSGVEGSMGMFLKHMTWWEILHRAKSAKSLYGMLPLDLFWWEILADW